MNVKIGIAAAVVLVAGIVGLVMWNQSQEATAPGETTVEPATSENTSDESATETVAETFTAAQVAAHNTAGDCWTIIRGSVYDITEYIPRHPGGEEILRACGRDGTSLFETRTTEDSERVGSGSPHSGSAAAQLEAFKVGTLAE